MAFCTPEEVDVLQRKMDELSNQKEAVSDRRDQKYLVLNDSADLVREFYELDKEVNEFFTDANKKLDEQSDDGTETILVSCFCYNSLLLICCQILKTEA